MQFTAKTIIQCLKINIKKDIATMIHGAPGIGKSQIVHQVAEQLGLELIDIRLNLRESVDLRGLPWVDSKSGTTKWLPPAELPTKGKGLLFLDEINSGISMSLQASAMGLVLERKLGEYHLPKGWVPIAAGNRVVDRAAAQRMATALSNRFSHFEMIPEIDDWAYWANSHDISPWIVGYLRFRPESLHRMPTSNEQSAFPTPRTWEIADKYMDVTDENVRLHLIASVVGEGAAVELEGFIQTSKNLPSIDSIMARPQIAAIPDSHQPSAMWAIGQALARASTNKNFKNALIYMARLPKEYEVAMVVDAITRDRGLINTRAYSEWCVSNQEVVL